MKIQIVKQGSVAKPGGVCPWMVDVPEPGGSAVKPGGVCPWMVDVPEASTR